MPDSWTVMSVRHFRLGNCKLDEINPILCMKTCSRTRKNGLQQNYFCFPHSWEVEVKLWYEVIHMRHPLLPFFFFLMLVLNISVLFSCHIFSIHLFLQFVCRVEVLRSWKQYFSMLVQGLRSPKDDLTSPAVLFTTTRLRTMLISCSEVPQPQISYHSSIQRSPML